MDKLKKLRVWENRYLLLIIGLHLIYFICALTIADTKTLDSDEYLNTGENLWKHGTVYNGIWASYLKPELFNLRPPLYGIYLGITSFFGTVPIFSILVQNILSIYLWISIANFVQKYIHTKQVYFYILIVLLLFPVQLILVNQYMADFLIEFVFFFAFIQFVSYVEQRKFKNWTYFNILIALCVLIKPVLLYFWVLIFLFTIYFYIKEKKWQLGITALFLPLVIVAWSYRNYLHTSVYEYTSLTHQLALEANKQHIDIANLGFEKANTKYKLLNEIISEIPTYRARIDTIHFIENQTIAANKFIYFKLLIKGYINCCINPGRMELNSFFGIKPTKEIGLFTGISSKGVEGIKEYLKSINLVLFFLLTLGFVMQMILIISFIYFLSKNKTIFPIIRIFMASSTLYAIVAAGVFGFARFKLIFLPFWVIGFVFAIDFITNNFHKNSSKLIA
jgi:hypothetical protein